VIDTKEYADVHGYSVLEAELLHRARSAGIREEAMKILVCGKGGTGKSTLVAVLAKELARRGKRVLIVDSDEPNFGLPGSELDFRLEGVGKIADLLEK